MIQRPDAVRRKRRTLQILCNALPWVVINVDPYNDNETLTVGDDACDIPKTHPIYATQTRSKSNALPWGVINVAPYKPLATFLVGDDACDIPKTHPIYAI